MNTRIAVYCAATLPFMLMAASNQQINSDLNAKTAGPPYSEAGTHAKADINESAGQGSSSQFVGLKTLDVYKTESCGCCGGWVSHMEDNNFATRVHHPEDLNQLKTELGIDAKWQSCHTAVSEQGYIFEGHIPANVVAEFLANPPENVLGLAVPGMPVGSPGMEVEERFSPYDVLLLKKDGSVETYRHIASREEQY